MINEKKFLVITPTYNEKENIKEFIQSILATDLPVLFIDDNSPDGTSDLIKEYQAKESKIFLVERPEKLGLGSAYRTGFEWAINNTFENLIEMDADFSHSFDDLKNLINNYSDVSALIGSRYIDGGQTIGWEKSRLLLSIYANKFAKFMSRSSINDMTSGFRIINCKTLVDIEYETSKSNGYAFQIEILARILNVGSSVKEIPIIFHERRRGKSKLERKIIYEALLLVVSLGFKSLVKIFK